MTRSRGRIRRTRPSWLLPSGRRGQGRRAAESVRPHLLLQSPPRNRPAVALHPPCDLYNVGDTVNVPCPSLADERGRAVRKVRGRSLKLDGVAPGRYVLVTALRVGAVDVARTKWPLEVQPAVEWTD